MSYGRTRLERLWDSCCVLFCFGVVVVICFIVGLVWVASNSESTTAAFEAWQEETGNAHISRNLWNQWRRTDRVPMKYVTPVEVGEAMPSAEGAPPPAVCTDSLGKKASELFAEALEKTKELRAKARKRVATKRTASKKAVEVGDIPPDLYGQWVMYRTKAGKSTSSKEMFDALYDEDKILEFKFYEWRRITSRSEVDEGTFNRLKKARTIRIY